MSEPNRDLREVLIDAAVQLGFRREIKASIPLAFASPIVATGLVMPWPWDQIFFGVGSVLAVGGAAFLLLVVSAVLDRP
jgi:hypothetical protein